MIPSPLQNLRIFLKPGITDMRKSINGLSGIVQNQLRLNPYDQSLFAFGNRRKDLVKILYWDRNGFCLWQKRLEKDRFPWPADEKQVMEITSEQLNWLLNGIDFRKAHAALYYTKAG
jgi:transposase